MCFTLGNQLQRLHVLSFNRPFSLILKNTFFYVRLRVRWCCKQNSGLPTCITDNPTFTVKLVGIIAALSNTYLPLPSKWRFDSWWARACQFYFHVRKSLSTDLCVLARQVFVSCNFCGKSISYSCSAMPHQGRGFSQYGVSGSPTKSKVTSCPGCRKPLPRCALCLMNMGTPVSNCPGKLACVENVDRCSADFQ